jgi:hypothetical protein
LCALRRETGGVEDLTHEVQGLEGHCLAAVVDLPGEEGAQGAAAVDARLDLRPEVAHELLLLDRVSARGHGGGVVNTVEQDVGFVLRVFKRGESSEVMLIKVRFGIMVMSMSESCSRSVLPRVCSIFFCKYISCMMI